MEVLGFAAAVVVGFILGLLGGGGSMLSIPILVYLFDIEPVRASAYSLFLVGITSMIGTIPKYREHKVNLRTGLLFGIPSIITIFITRKWVVPLIPDTVATIGNLVLSKRLLLLGLFAVLMILAAIPLIRGRKEIESTHPRFRTLLVFVEGLLIGFLTGLVGAGGGFLITPALVFLTGLNFKTAVGTSLLVIAVNSLAGFLGDVLNYRMEWAFLFGITALAVVGILLGTRLSRNVDSLTLRKAFGWFTLFVGASILLAEVV
jgi:uncharacterized membrane protein YfcA